MIDRRSFLRTLGLGAVGLTLDPSPLWTPARTYFDLGARPPAIIWTAMSIHQIDALCKAHYAGVIHDLLNEQNALLTLDGRAVYTRLTHATTPGDFR